MIIKAWCQVYSKAQKQLHIKVCDLVWQNIYFQVPYEIFSKIGKEIDAEVTRNTNFSQIVKLN